MQEKFNSYDNSLTGKCDKPYYIAGVKLQRSVPHLLALKGMKGFRG